MKPSTLYNLYALTKILGGKKTQKSKVYVTVLKNIEQAIRIMEGR
jgi:hypothetical protein